jgi:hypothetical protein
MALCLIKQRIHFHGVVRNEAQGQIYFAATEGITNNRPFNITNT